MTTGDEFYWDDRRKRELAENVFSTATVTFPHPISEGEPTANLEEMLTFARAYIPIRELMFSKAEHEKIVSAKDTEIASLLAQIQHMSYGNEEFLRRMNLALIAQAEAETARDQALETGKKMIAELYRVTDQLLSAQSEITRLTSQQNSTETKAEFPAFNSAEWKPPMP